MAAPMEDWRSPNKRNQIVQKLEERIKALGNPPAGLQNPVEVEKALFEKSKNGEEYRNNFHNVILMLTRQKQAHPAQPMPSRPMVNMGPGGQQMPNPGFQQPYNQYGGMGGAPNQVPNPGGYVGNMGPMGGPQRPQPPQYHPGMYPPGGGNPNMHMPQQPQYPSNMGMVPGYQQNQPMPSAGGFNAPHNVGVMGSGGGGGYSSGGGGGAGGGGPGGHFNQPMMGGSGGMPHGGMMRPPVMRPPGPNMAPRPGMQQSQMQAHPQGGQPSPFVMDTVGVQPVAIPNPSYSSSVRPPAATVAYTAASSANGQLGGHPGSVPSPFSSSSNVLKQQGMQPPSSSASSSSSSMPGNPQPNTSAATVMSNPTGPPAPDGQPQLPPTAVPGTTSAPGNPPTPRTGPGNLHGPVPSPAPPTPLCPTSPATSGIGSPATQPAMTPEENEAYLRKLSELQKYIPLMSKWINKLSRDDRKSDQILKLKSLYNLLQDDKKRVPLQTLMKCEIALEKMFKENSNPNSVPPPPTPPIQSEPPVPEPKISSPPQSQSLLDFKMSHSPPPTYSNMMDAFQPIRRIPFEELPIVKRLLAKIEDLPYPQSLRLELPHLSRFKLEFKPKDDKFDKTTTIICSLADENLPEVPPLTVVLPADYPAHKPICDLDHYKQSSVAFIREVGNQFSQKLATKTTMCSLVTLLDLWEQAILKAMAIELATEDED